MGGVDPLTVRSTSDPGLALAEAEAFLAGAAEYNNIILSVLAERVARYRDGRYWWVCRGSAPVAFALQSPGRFRAVVAPAPAEAVAALVEVIAAEAPGLPGIMADAATATLFAGCWADTTNRPVRPVEAQRLYRVRSVRHPEGVGGGLRLAEDEDRPLLVRWTAAFLADTGSNPFEPEEIVGARLASRRLWLWEVDGEPVSMAAASIPAGGVARVALVYTPPEDRRRAYAAACVAAVSERVLAEGSGCILHAQLHNPTPKALYRRLGYEPIGEVLVYRFG